MKSTLIPILAILAATALSSPLTTTPLEPTPEANMTTEGTLANCIIRGFTSGDCSSGNIWAYNFVVDGCRSCEPFDNSHSFSLSDGCPSGTFYSNEGPCNNHGSQFAIGFRGPGCYGVNTGANWVSGNPCFN